MRGPQSPRANWPNFPASKVAAKPRSPQASPPRQAAASPPEGPGDAAPASSGAPALPARRYVSPSRSSGLGATLRQAPELAGDRHRVSPSPAAAPPTPAAEPASLAHVLAGAAELGETWSGTPSLRAIFPARS